MGSERFSYLLSSSESAISHDIQIRKSVMLTLTHIIAPPRLYCSWTNTRLFQVYFYHRTKTLWCHSLDFVRIHPKNRNWLQSFCIRTPNSMFNNPLLSIYKVFVFNGVHTVGLHSQRLSSWNLFYIVLRIRVALVLLSPRVVNLMYRSLFGIIWMTLAWSTSTLPCFLKSSPLSCNDTSYQTLTIRYTIRSAFVLGFKWPDNIRSHRFP